MALHSPSASSNDGVAYRRVLKSDWKLTNTGLTIKPAAFVPKPGTSLSIFLATKVPNRRYVLQDHINKRLQKLQDPAVDDVDKQKIQRQLEQGELTVDTLYRVGWPIVEFPIRLFPGDVFRFEPPMGEEDGHQNVIGPDDEFQLCAVECAREARMLSAEECLHG